MPGTMLPPRKFDGHSKSSIDHRGDPFGEHAERGEGHSTSCSTPAVPTSHESSIVPGYFFDATPPAHGTPHGSAIAASAIVALTALTA